MSQESEESEERAEYRAVERAWNTSLLRNEHVGRALNAYARAASAKHCSVHTHDKHPDLHFNRAAVHRSTQAYQLAIDDLRAAHALGVDDLLSDHSGHHRPQKGSNTQSETQTGSGSLAAVSAIVARVETLDRHLKHCARDGSGKQGKPDSKLRRAALALNPRLTGLTEVFFEQCRVGSEREKGETECVLVARVVSLVPVKDVRGTGIGIGSLPLHCVAVDGMGSLFILSLFTLGLVTQHILSLLSFLLSPSPLSSSPLSIPPLSLSLCPSDTCLQSGSSPSNLLCIRNPVRRDLRCTQGSSSLSVASVSFHSVSDLSLGARSFHF